jgi:hypothetical protein
MNNYMRTTFITPFFVQGAPFPATLSDVKESFFAYPTRSEYDDYFHLKKDATCKLGFTSYEKCTAARVAGDLVDEYMHMSESTSLESMYRFCIAVFRVFAGEYLRELNVDDTVQLLSINESRGFPGSLEASIACTGNGGTVLLAWQGQLSGHAEGCTIILDAVVSQDL